MKEFTKGNTTIELYIKDENINFSFRVKNDNILTEKLLAICKKKTIKEKDIKYAIPALFDKIEIARNNDYYEVWKDDGIPHEFPEAICYTKEQLYLADERLINVDIVILINGDRKNKIDPYFLTKYFKDDKLA